MSNSAELERAVEASIHVEGTSGRAAFRSFCDDAGEILTADSGREGLEKLRQRFLPLLTNMDFLDTYCGPGTAQGSHNLYTDEQLGFTIFAYVGKPGRGESPPHDHGDDWAIYGQSRLHTDMRDFRIVSGSRYDNSAVVEETAEYRLNPGDAHLYHVGDIHSINPIVDCIYIRIAGSPADYFTPVGPTQQFDEIWGPAYTERPPKDDG